MNISDPRYELFQTLQQCVRENRPQDPMATSEVDCRYYTDPAWFDHEMKTIFSDVPLILGPASMLKEPGEHITHDHTGKPILLVRGRDRKLRAFLNVCRHRGVRLADAPEVKRKPTFTCPYHHWTYALDGELTHVPVEESFPDFDKHCRSLVALPTEEAHGLVWVNPNKEGTLNLPGFLGNIARDLDNFGLADDHFFKQTVQTRQCNWKLIVEAFQDGYHVTRLHQRSVGGFFLDCVAAQEREQQHIRSIVARKEFAESLQLPPEQWDFRNHASFAHFIWPNTIMVFHPDYISQMALYPQSPSETVVVHSCVIDREPLSEAELAHYERGFAMIEDGVFNAEDLHVCEQAQIGMDSGANDTLLIGGHEGGLRNFYEIVEETTGPYRP
jgi:phenylpropionate dioxygenase-like ring-hydroxylating dioxygenase large terminal subunit